MSGGLTIRVRGVEMRLLPERAVYLPARGELLIADMHCGKAAAFRAHGVPIPEGSTEADLERLGGLLRRTGAAALTILGDWIHSPAGCDERMIRAVAEWRERHAEVAVRWVRGNHDAGAGELSGRLGFEDVPSLLESDALCFRHKPVAHGELFTLAGHVHPVFLLPKDGSRGRLRLPCFHFTPSVATLPAFGSFTGGQQIRPGPEDRVFLTTGDAVVEWRRAHS